MGSMRTASAKLPARPEKCPDGTTINGVGEDPDGDRGHARHDVGGEPHGGRQVPPALDEEQRHGQAHRHGHDGGQPDDDQGADDGVVDAAAGNAFGYRQLGEEVDRQCLDPAGDGVPDQGHQGHQRDQHGEATSQPGGVAGDPAPAQGVAGGLSDHRAAVQDRLGRQQIGCGGRGRVACHAVTTPGSRAGPNSSCPGALEARERNKY